jgi:hypothetical protein
MAKPQARTRIRGDDSMFETNINKLESLLEHTGCLVMAVVLEETKLLNKSHTPLGPLEILARDLWLRLPMTLRRNFGGASLG